AVRKAGLTLPRVDAATRYDGLPVLKVGGCFMAGLATHSSAGPGTRSVGAPTQSSAGPGTLVVRARFEDRALLLEDAPETYYVTPYYEKYPVVLARLPRLDRDALH